MVQLRLKLLMELSPDITECGNKENKPPLTRLPAFSLGPEAFSIEPSSTTIRNSTISAKLLKLV